MSLPSGYKQLEYIQSSGTQYIDTGIAPSSTLKVVTTFTVNDDGWNNYSIFGSAWSESGFMVDALSGGKIVFYSKGYGKQVPANVGSPNTIECSQSEFVVNGTSYQMTGTGTESTNNIFIFWVGNQAYTDNRGRMKLYSFQMYDNGTLVRDFVPCISDSGDVGLYDIVEEQFYANIGTGTFTAGPEVPMPPKAPTGFYASLLTDTTAKLSWDASDGATGYKLYKAGDLIATLTDTNYTDTVELFYGYTYSVTAYNDDGESEATTLNYYAVPENPILYLVTDRTAADVNAWNDKGTYKASDLNRVGAAMNYVADRLRATGYDPHISPKTDWKDDDWVDPAAQAVYLGDLAELRKQFTMLESTPEVPPRILATGIRTNDGLTYVWANNIEQILVDIDALLTNIAAGWLYSGEIYSGEV